MEILVRQEECKILTYFRKELAVNLVNETKLLSSLITETRAAA